MRPQSITSMFGGLTFQKTSQEIIDAAAAKVWDLTDSVQRRQASLAAWKAEYGIDDAALNQLLIQARRVGAEQQRTFSYLSNASSNAEAVQERTISAGVVNAMLTESDFIEEETASIQRLRLIVRNLRPLQQKDGTTLDAVELDFKELTFLGF